MIWMLADRTQWMQSSSIRDILKHTQRGEVLSMAGGLPAEEAFPIEAVARACATVLKQRGPQALQYGASEGVGALREWIASRLTAQSGGAWPVQADQVLVTTGSQQALDLLGKVLMQPGREVGAEQPSYLGALQAFQPYGPTLMPLESDAEGVLPHAVCGRLSYLVPTYQNPTGHCLSEARRQALALALNAHGGTIIEDNPYGDLWFDAPPPASLASRLPSQVVYLGSLSKVLAPGLRLGFMVLPQVVDESGQALRNKLIQAKQAADLHTASLSQHVVCQMLEDGFDWDAHAAFIGQQYRAKRDVLDQALRREMPSGWTWQRPGGGMFLWLTGPHHVNTQELLAQALAHQVAYVPGASFYPASHPDAGRTMRLSYVTLGSSALQEAAHRLARLFQAG